MLFFLVPSLNDHHVRAQCESLIGYLHQTIYQQTVQRLLIQQVDTTNLNLNQMVYANINIEQGVLLQHPNTAVRQMDLCRKNTKN